MQNLYCLKIVNQLIAQQKLFITLVVLLINSLLMSQEFSNSAGLQFNSVYEKGSDGQSIPTSLILPENGSFHFDSNIEFSFEIYFRKKDPFGFILSATNKNESNYLILSYSDYRNPDTSYIDLTIEGNVSVISIPVPDILWAEFSWKLLSIQFNYSLNKIGLSFDNSSMTWYKAKMPIHRDLQFQFGRISQKVEPPRMVIRNINLNENSKSNIHWPLNEISGDIAIGSMENGREYPGKVKNANWLRRYHFQWRKVYSQDITGKDFQYFGFNEEMCNTVYAINDSFFLQNPYNPDLESHFSFVPLHSENNYNYDNLKHQLISWNGAGDSPIYTYNFETKDWIGYDQNFISKDQHYLHGIIKDSENDDWYILGGYGWYTIKNDLQVYDSSIREWIKVDLKTENEDLYYPRNEMTIKADSKNRTYLIFGGGGNESGKQEQGFRKFNDLWSLDLRTKTISKLWDDDPNLTINDFQQNTVLIPESNRIYTLLTTNNITDSTHNILYESFIDQKDFQNTQIRFYPDDVNYINIISLEYIKKTNELMLITTVKRNGSIDNKEYLEYYTLSLPLISHVINQRTEISHWILVILVFLVGSILWHFWKHWTKSDGIQLVRSLIPPSTIEKNYDDPNFILSQGVTVQVFGDFRLWVDGREIHQNEWHSKKARELFLFILLKNSRGVSIKNINLEFWPDVNGKSAANSRAVSLNKIRKIIFPYGDLIVKIDNRLSFQKNEKIYSDYIDLFHQIENGNIKNILDKKWPIIFHGKDGVLLDMKNDWIDRIRVDMVRNIINYSKKLGIEYKNKSEWENLVWVGKRILEIDSLNDDGLFYAVIGNKNLVKNGNAHKIYKEYCLRYKNEIGEKYQTTYEMIGEFNL